MEIFFGIIAAILVQGWINKEEDSDVEDFAYRLINGKQEQFRY